MAAALPPQAPSLEALTSEAFEEARRPGISKIRYTHEDCVNAIIAEPWISQNELAARYGYSAAWMSTVINSNAFKERLAARRAEVVDPVLMATLEERFRALATRSVEVLQEKLSLPSHMVPDQLALQAAALGAKSLGMGVPQPPPAAAEADLHVLADRLRSFVRRERNGDAVDVPVRAVEDPPLLQRQG